jgi:hypothetical protein
MACLNQSHDFAHSVSLNVRDTRNGTSADSAILLERCTTTIAGWNGVGSALYLVLLSKYYVCTSVGTECVCKDSTLLAHINIASFNTNLGD